MKKMGRMRRTQPRIMTVQFTKLKKKVHKKPFKKLLKKNFPAINDQYHYSQG